MSDEDDCRSSARHSEPPGFADVCFGYEAYGFRCVRGPAGEKVNCGLPAGLSPRSSELRWRLRLNVGTVRISVQSTFQERDMNATTPIRQPRQATRIILRTVLQPILAAWLALAAQARAADLFVSLQGNDAWSGRLAEPNAAKTDGPLATIEHAQQLVRQLKAVAGRTTPIVVAIRGGTYYPRQADPFRPRGFGHGRRLPSSTRPTARNGRSSAAA